jgi:hypothetical protein
MERMGMYIRSEGTEYSVKFVRLYHFIGIFVILLIAGPLHFAYEWSVREFFHQPGGSCQ